MKAIFTVVFLCFIQNALLLPSLERHDSKFGDYLIMPDDRGVPRLTNMVPNGAHRAVIESEVNLLLFTRENLHEPIVMGPSDISILLDSPFDATKKTLIAIHGWTGGATSSSSIYPKNATLEMLDCNVLAVDWEIPASVDYAEAKLNVPEVGAFVANFVILMQEQAGVSLDDVTLFGHSLGAHVVGVVGGLLNGNVGIIVASDPAGPGYDDTEIPENKLDPSDAKFVQVIHTNTHFLGLNASVGAVDFYPNGGALQPGCEDDAIGFCSHNRGWAFYTESILTAGFTSTLCTSIDDLTGPCVGNPTSHLGGLVPDTAAPLGNYYLFTNAEQPYSQG